MLQCKDYQTIKHNYTSTVPWPVLSKHMTLLLVPFFTVLYWPRPVRSVRCLLWSNLLLMMRQLVITTVRVHILRTSTSTSRGVELRVYIAVSVSQSLHASKPGMIGPEGKSQCGVWEREGGSLMTSDTTHSILRVSHFIPQPRWGASRQSASSG